MSLETFSLRMPENVPGKFYVGNQCTDCDLCRQIAPENFARDPNGYSYVKKQPTTREEIACCRHAIDGCCVETIHSDGDLFEWNTNAATGDFTSIGGPLPNSGS